MNKKDEEKLVLGKLYKVHRDVYPWYEWPLHELNPQIPIPKDSVLLLVKIIESEEDEEGECRPIFLWKDKLVTGCVGFHSTPFMHIKRVEKRKDLEEK